MKQKFYKLHELVLGLGDVISYYGLIKEGKSNNLEVRVVYLALLGAEAFPVEIHQDQQKNTVWISDFDYIKKPVEILFRTEQERKAFDVAYEAYYDRRWYDMPQVEMSLQNYQELQHKWQKIEQEKPQYVIFTLDDSGDLDVVDVIGKNELSPQDQEDMKREHQEYLRWKKAKQLFYTDYPEMDDIWRSPADDEYEADIAKYLDREVGFFPPKIYTQKEIGLELKKRVALRQYPELIGHWIGAVSNQTVTDRDKKFDEVVDVLRDMQYRNIDHPSYEKLELVADDMIAGTIMDVGHYLLN